MVRHGAVREVAVRGGRPLDIGESMACWSGRGWDLDDAAILLAEVPGIDGRRFHAERREGGADLAAMIRPVVQRLREPDAIGAWVSDPSSRRVTSRNRQPQRQETT